MDSKKVKMKKIYWINCNKYRKLKNPINIIYFRSNISFSIIFNNCGSKDESI